MKKAFSLSFAVMGLLVSFVSRGQSVNALYQHLPPNADHVTEINFNQLNAKGNFSALLNAIPPTGSGQTNLILGALRDPSSAGIDFSNNIFVAQTSASGNDADTLDFTSIIVQLSDSAKFRNLLAQAIPGLEVSTAAGKGMSYGKDKMGVAWNDKMVVVTMASSDVLAKSNGATPASAALSPSELAVEKSFEALAGYSASPWLTDQRFLAGFATDDDVHAWSTGMNLRRTISRLMSKLGKKGGMPALPTMPDYSKGPHQAPILSIFNFGNGKIEFRMTFFNQPADAAAMRDLMDHPFNKDLLARVPDGLLLGWAALNISPRALEHAMDKYGTRKIVDSMLAKHGLTMDEITAPFTGDVLVAAVVPQPANDADTAKKKIRFYFVAGITDPAKLMKLGAKLHAAAPPAADTSRKNPFRNIQKKMVIRDNLLVISNSREDAEKYFSNQNRRPTDLLGENNAMQRVVIDLKAVSALVGSSMSNDPKAMIASRILERLDKIVFTNGVMDGNNMIADLQILTGDPNTNSLETLMSILH